MRFSYEKCTHAPAVRFSKKASPGSAKALFRTVVSIAAGELLFHDIDPGRIPFKRFGCMDVGLKCGGWGHAVMALSIQESDMPA